MNWKHFLKKVHVQSEYGEYKHGTYKYNKREYISNEPNYACFWTVEENIHTYRKEHGHMDTEKGSSSDLRDQCLLVVKRCLLLIYYVIQR